MAVNHRAQLSMSARIGLLRHALARSPESFPVLFELSEALYENHEHGESADFFRRAFALNPTACSVIASPGLKPGADRGRKMRERASALIANGVLYSPVIAALAVGESLCGGPFAGRLRSVFP
jgi:hypothetical protein